MAVNSTFPNGFLNGVSIRNVPILQLHPGTVRWVNNSTVGNPGTDDLRSGSFRNPYRTLNYASARCTASAGDILVIMPGHAETISTATALTLSKAGIAVVGLGDGSLTPTFTLGTVVGATVNITAANISLMNLRFKANLADITSAITTTSAQHLKIVGCDFIDNSSILNFARIIDTDATSNNMDGLTILNCNWYGKGATSNSCVIKMDGTNDRVTIKDCYFRHAAVTDAGLMPIATTKVVTNLIVDNNDMLFTGATGATTGTMITTDTSTNTGIIKNNRIQSLDATFEILVTASSGFVFFENKSSAVADKSGYLLPAADA